MIRILTDCRSDLAAKKAKYDTAHSAVVAANQECVDDARGLKEQVVVALADTLQDFSNTTRSADALNAFVAEVRVEKKAGGDGGNRRGVVVGPGFLRES